MSLHDILYLWRIRVVTNQVGDLSSLSLESLYPLSPHQTAILADITATFSSRQSSVSDDNHSAASDSTRQKYRLLLGKPGTGKSQVLICAISYTIRHELSVLVAAPVASLAQGYNSIFYEKMTTDTLHGAFRIPIDRRYPNEINHRINHYDLIVVDEASMISSPIFGVMATAFNRMNLRPVVVLAGDKCQQQPLQTVNGHITSTTSIINENATFPSSNAVIHRLHQQFRIVDPEYAAFLYLTWFIRPTQEQVNKMQGGHVLCPEDQLSERQIWTPLQSHPNSTVMTVSRKGAQRINTIVVGQLFQGRPLTNIPCTCVADSQPIYTHRNMRVIFTENRDKAARVSHTLPFYTSIWPNHHQGSGPKHSTSHHLAGLTVGSSRYCLCWPLQSEKKIGHLFAAAYLCRPTNAGAAPKRPPYSPMSHNRLPSLQLSSSFLFQFFLTHKSPSSSLCYSNALCPL